ncbi:ornithine carbamoyltransferase [Patescibacteria group bacterium]|nr:ornithine carbamoyltransferase [Patescibacteria group bacterium]MBU1015589.1 ornithine carbamoyltransferase [Patescibacteria group bacterium]MBU1685537.1 ornithine carbamoyltransferase [Patescibacteria group bacterium]MBU1938292.1 ornithine carbamoyltransferase [Patescibacteria group bacterium]
MKKLTDLTDFTNEEIISIIDLAVEIKRDPMRYSQTLSGKTLLMIFDKASLRTRVSFEVGMTQMGGHAIYYNVATSPLGKKETMSDTARAASRYVDLIMARIGPHEDLVELANTATVPVINAMTNFSHPCQILADLQTIREKKGYLKGLKLAYCGDSNNNVTHSLLFGCSIMGINISVCCPEGTEYEPMPEVLEKANALASSSGSSVEVTHDAKSGASGADVIYTDSWMSYHISEEQKEERINIFKPYQVDQKLMGFAKPDAIFMNCLPAMRGMEQTAEVVDGPQSIVFDQAENRLHAQKALMLELLGIKA